MNDSYRNELENQLYQSARALDTAITAISTGALVLSIALIKDFASILDAYVIYACWIFLLLSIATQTISHGTSLKAFEYQKTLYDSREIYNNPPPSNRWSIATNYLNWIARVSLAIGMILITVYGLKNVRPKETVVPVNCAKCVEECSFMGQPAKSYPYEYNFNFTGGEIMEKKGVVPAKPGVVPQKPPPEPDRRGGVVPQKPPPQSPPPQTGGEKK